MGNRLYKEEIFFNTFTHDTFALSCGSSFLKSFHNQAESVKVPIIISLFTIHPSIKNGPFPNLFDRNLLNLSHYFNPDLEG